MLDEARRNHHLLRISLQVHLKPGPRCRTTGVTNRRDFRRCDSFRETSSSQTSHRRLSCSGRLKLASAQEQHPPQLKEPSETVSARTPQRQPFAPVELHVPSRVEVDHTIADPPAYLGLDTCNLENHRNELLMTIGVTMTVAPHGVQQREAKLSFPTLRVPVLGRLYAWPNAGDPPAVR